MSTRLEVDLYHSLHTTHQEFALSGYQRTNAAAHIQASPETVSYTHLQGTLLVIVVERYIISTVRATTAEGYVVRCRS